MCRVIWVTHSVTVSHSQEARGTSERYIAVVCVCVEAKVLATKLKHLLTFHTISEDSRNVISVLQKATSTIYLLLAEKARHHHEGPYRRDHLAMSRRKSPGYSTTLARMSQMVLGASPCRGAAAERCKANAPTGARGGAAGKHGSVCVFFFCTARWLEQERGAI